MKKRVFIIHGWEGSSDEPMHKWLKDKLEEKNFEVIAPKMPNTDEPIIEEWVSKVNNIVGRADKNTYFIGHSIGCQAIMRYLETIEDKKIKIGGTIFIAPWFDLNEISYTEEPEYEEESRNIAKPWINTKINLEKIKKICNNYVTIFSDNDFYVHLDNSKIFKKELNAKIIIEHNKGHFTEDDGVTKLPVAIKEIERIANLK